MTIDPDVQRIARHFAGDSYSFPTLLRAIETAEHNLIAAVRCSDTSVTTLEQARDQTCRTMVHRMSDFIYEHYRDEFVACMAQSFAPIGATNDPKQLNRNWTKNVQTLWRQGTASRGR